MTEESFQLPDYCSKRILIIGCGNILFGDDGFGPAVVEKLAAGCGLDDDVCIVDAGTGARKILFTLTLDPACVERIVIVDAVDKGRVPGEIFEIPIEVLPPEKEEELSLHYVPSSNLAKELQKVGIDVRVFVCQVDIVPESVVPGLSDRVKDAVPRMCDRIMREISKVRSQNSKT